MNKREPRPRKFISGGDAVNRSSVVQILSVDSIKTETNNASVSTGSTVSPQNVQRNVGTIVTVLKITPASRISKSAIQPALKHVDLGYAEHTPNASSLRMATTNAIVLKAIMVILSSSVKPKRCDSTETAQVTMIVAPNSGARLETMTANVWTLVIKNDASLIWSVGARTTLLNVHARLALQEMSTLGVTEIRS